MLGLAAVRFRNYCQASLIGMLPAIIVYTYVGSVAKDIVGLTNGNLQGGMAGQVLLLIGLAATIVLTTLITRKARRILTEPLERERVGPHQSREKGAQRMNRRGLSSQVGGRDCGISSFRRRQSGRYLL